VQRHKSWSKQQARKQANKELDITVNEIEEGENRDKETRKKDIKSKSSHNSSKQR